VAILAALFLVLVFKKKGDYENSILRTFKLEGLGHEIFDL
jgi:hypothetical protein